MEAQPNDMPGLTPGRMVHYIAERITWAGVSQDAHCAAIVTHLVTGRFGAVDLMVLTPSGSFFTQDVPFAPPSENIRGTWHWIEPA